MTADLDTFKRLYLQEFGVVLNDKEAERKARALMQIYQVVYGSPTIKKIEDENIVYGYCLDRERKPSG